MTDINLIKGSDLKIKLKKMGISSVDLCRAFGYNKTTVSRYFTDDMQMPASFIVEVAKYANLKVSDSYYISKCATLVQK